MQSATNSGNNVKQCNLPQIQVSLELLEEPTFWTGINLIDPSFKYYFIN